PWGTLTIDPANAVAVTGPHGAGVTADRLAVATTALLDLRDHAIVVDNTATPEPAVRQYLKNAYNPDPATGIGNWLGKGAISGAGNYNGPTYGATRGPSTPTLTAPGSSADTLAATTTQGSGGDGVLDFFYDPQNGHLIIQYDGDPRVTASQPFQVIRFKSAAG